jgi:hypothetical protein
MIRNIRADTKQIRLLDVLSGQLKSLVDEGQPDLDSQLTSMILEVRESSVEGGVRLFKVHISGHSKSPPIS